MEFNQYKKAIHLEGESVETLLLKLSKINCFLNTSNFWSDGKKHFVIVRTSRNLSPSEKQEIAKIK